MPRLLLRLLALLGVVALADDKADFEHLLQTFQAATVTTFREMSQKNMDVAELMADVSHDVPPPGPSSGLICWVCRNCGSLSETRESSAICAECYVKVADSGKITRGCNAKADTVCTTDIAGKSRCCKTDYCNGHKGGGPKYLGIWLALYLLAHDSLTFGEWLRPL